MCSGDGIAGEGEQGVAVEVCGLFESVCDDEARFIDGKVEGIDGSFNRIGIDGDWAPCGVGIEGRGDIEPLPDGERDVSDGLKFGVIVPPAGLEELVIGFAEIPLAEAVSLAEGIEAYEEGEFMFVGLFDHVVERVETWFKLVGSPGGELFVYFGGVEGVAVDWFDIKYDGVEAGFGGFLAEVGDFLDAVDSSEVGGSIDPEDSGLKIEASSGGLGDADFGELVVDLDRRKGEGGGEFKPGCGVDGLGEIDGLLVEGGGSRDGANHGPDYARFRDWARTCRTRLVSPSDLPMLSSGPKRAATRSSLRVSAVWGGWLWRAWMSSAARAMAESPWGLSTAI